MGLMQVGEQLAEAEEVGFSSRLVKRWPARLVAVGAGEAGEVGARAAVSTSRHPW